MDKKTLDALNEQMREEIASAYLYLAMSSDMKFKGLNGSASWFQTQAKEEIVHATKFYNYIHDRGGQAVLPALEKPQVSWKSLKEAFEATLEHEKHITSCIDKLVDMAREKNDHATEAFLQWFITEQVEEEASADEILQKLKFLGDSPHGVYMLDRELGARQTVAADASQE
ncbi:MAG: ferritin [Spirochaetales bacterium]|nr:ferritin [Spirochaetales bacterium]